MTLPDWMIALLASECKLVEPYDSSLVNPASIDLRLGRRFINRSEAKLNYVLEGKTYVASEGEAFEADSVYLIPGVALLASTLEYIRIPATPTLIENPFYSALQGADANNPKQFLLNPLCASVYLKSSAARRGLDHALAGWVDPGFEGELTLELHSHTEEVIEAGKRYVQLVLLMMFAPPTKGYGEVGRYQGQTGPTEARTMKGEK